MQPEISSDSRVALCHMAADNPKVDCSLNFSAAKLARSDALTPICTGEVGSFPGRWRTGSAALLLAAAAVGASQGRPGD